MKLSTADGVKLTHTPGEKDVLAYDMTTLLFFGVSCPLAELGYNPDRIRRKQANLALLVSKRDLYPMMHFVYNGSRHSISTVKNLIACLNQASMLFFMIVVNRARLALS